MADTLNAPLLERIAPNLLPELKAYLERHRADLVRMLDTEGEAMLGRWGVDSQRIQALRRAGE